MVIIVYFFITLPSPFLAYDFSFLHLRVLSSARASVSDADIHSPIVICCSWCPASAEEVCTTPSMSRVRASALCKLEGPRASAECSKSCVLAPLVLWEFWSGPSVGYGPCCCTWGSVPCGFTNPTLFPHRMWWCGVYTM